MSLKDIGMKGAILTIGDEILIGQIVDTNSAWIATHLNDFGIEIHESRSIQDNRKEIIRHLDALKPEVELVIVTGGLGPTKDDITKACLADYFNSELYQNKEILSDIENLFKKKGRDLLQVIVDQALIPVKATVVRNPIGTAAGMWFAEDGFQVISLPGVPVEMKAMMTSSVLPKLKEDFKLGLIKHRTIHVDGLPESVLAERLSAWEDDMPRELRLAYLPSAGIVRLRLSARGEDEAKLDRLLEQKVSGLKRLVGDRILGEGDINLSIALGELLAINGLSVSTAESCTGGRLSSVFTANSGSSKYYKGSIISYFNESKVRDLGVDEDILKTKGAVSEEVVRAMAEGVRERFQTDYAISTSGVAGSEEEEGIAAGTIWIAVSGPSGTESKKYSFGKDRNYNLMLATNMSLYRLWKQIKNDLAN